MEILDPRSLQPTAGRAVVEIAEQLGGMTRSGLFRPPPSESRNHLKDTVWGRILKIGPRPTYLDDTTRQFLVPDAEPETPWPDAWYSAFSEGDVILLPRDLPRVFVWGDQRYAIVHLAEAKVLVPGAEWDPMRVEIPERE